MGFLAMSGILLSSPLWAADLRDVQSGEEVYAKCIACHSPDRNRTGPLHCGVVDRISGTVEGYAYSNAMRGAAVTWTVAALDRFLAAPLDVIPETSMGFAGISDATERRQLIAWLATLTPASSHCDGVELEQMGDRHD